MTAGTGLIRLLALHTVLGLLSLLTACRNTEPAYVVGLHCFADQNLDPSRLVQTVWDPLQAQQVQVYANAFLGARRFYAGEILPAGEGKKCGLRLYIDPRGHNIWRQSIGEFRGSQFAVIVDGFYIGRSSFPTDFKVLTHVDLAPLWGRGEAEHIIGWVEKNYLKLNRLD
ncbi:MAG: hypothetical protein GX564_12400 [Oligosphaeraceae bacterium]|nr:hypothetical protein [Oligosphaeraceae bacterium]